MTHELTAFGRLRTRMGIAVLEGIGATVRALPPAAWNFGAGLLTPILWRGLRKHRVRALDNLEAQGYDRAEAVRIGKASFRSNLLVLFESLAMKRILSRRGIRVDSVVSPEAREALERIRRGEEPLALGVSGHIGCWEMLGAELARLCHPVPVVISARLVKNPMLADWLVKVRKGFGLHLVEKDEYVRYLMKHFRKKEPRVYVFLCDQHLKDGYREPFMGRPACTVGMPASLHFKFGGTLLKGWCTRVKAGHYRITVDYQDTSAWKGNEHETASRALTGEINRYLGDAILQAPAQWTWAHRRWRDCCGEPEITP